MAGPTEEGFVFWTTIESIDQQSADDVRQLFDQRALELNIASSESKRLANMIRHYVNKPLRFQRTSTS